MIPASVAGMIHAETAKQAAEKLDVIEQAAKAAGVAVETIRESNDHPWEAIIHAAEAKGCDLIVMASHGRRGRISTHSWQRDAEGVDPFDRSSTRCALETALSSHQSAVAGSA